MLRILYLILRWFNILFLIGADSLFIYITWINPSLVDGIILILVVATPLLIFNLIVYCLIIVANWLKYKTFPKKYFFEALLFLLLNPSIIMSIVFSQQLISLPFVMRFWNGYE